MRKLFTVLLVLLQLHVLAVGKKVTIDHIEPAFWWAGMQHPTLQVLVHGEAISDLMPSLSKEGVVLEEVIKVENPNYLFLNLRIDQAVQPGKFPIVFKRKGKEVFTYEYELKKRREGAASREGFSNKDIMYLITPDRFANGNPDNDSVEGMREGVDRSNPAGRHGGDIQGIIDQLDYIQAMGFTAIWVNPLLENNMEKYSYHGYATTDYYKIDPRFGTNDDYLRLSAEAKKRGIKLIMDQIENHCGSFHWWHDDLPTSNWYNFQDSKEVIYSSHNRISLADPYTSQSDLKMHSDGWFDTIMPDMNQRNPLVANYLIQNSIWWIEYADLGGVRQDTYAYPDAEFMAEWSKRIMKEYPSFNIVGEEWTKNPAIVSRWQKGKVNKNGYTSYLPSLMDFPIQETLIEVLNKETEPWKSTFSDVYEMLSNDFLYPDPYNLVVFADNHDTPRLYNAVHENKALFKMGLVYLFSVRGIPQIYYGTEIMMSGDVNNPKDHSTLRVDMPGGWAGDTSDAFKGKGLSDDAKEAQQLIKKLANFRKNTTALQDGKLMHFVPRDEIYVMFRYDSKTKVMSIFNKKTDTMEVELKRYQEQLEGITKGKDVVTGKVYDLSKGTISLEGTSALMLVLE
ncbi:glycoside hydrolase family 13 protein [Flammeovirga agarivorans]|uniref:Glycoside hydrolase family 13 protein n=1 Tax=Flammeovirga agarivorans TaxID=2726742 RepID=A0A7X8SJX5_9BACT|nr:glycoside hydrolase family 13 protein [Flammeovirga agarivorans]NLR91604.1 glycoside hydrolase family 13 protein [Flammeovirga agarivorans]